MLLEDLFVNYYLSQNKPKDTRAHLQISWTARMTPKRILAVVHSNEAAMSVTVQACKYLRCRCRLQPVSTVPQGRVGG